MSDARDQLIERAEFDRFIGERIASDGLVVLGRIPVNGGSQTCRPFTNVDAARAWSDKWNPGHGIYIVNNAPKPEWTPEHEGAERDGGDPPDHTDIPVRRRYQIDADPLTKDERSPEVLAALKAEAVSLIEQFETESAAHVAALPDGVRPSGVIRARLIVDSGRGVHAHFELNPLAVASDTTTGVNERIIQWFRDRAKLCKFDGVANVARVMRCPGTTNPRTGQIVRVIRREPESAATPALWMNVLPPEAGTLSAPASKPGASPKVSIDRANVKRLGHVDELGSNVSEKCKWIIVNGTDPDNPSRWDSRSEPLLHVVCELMRAGIDDATIYGVITNPAWGISASVLDKGSGTERYALRQIERARDEVGDDAVSSINRDYFAAIEGSKVTYYREEKDGPATPMNSEAFSFELATRKVEVDDGKGNTKSIPAILVWKDSPRRRFYPRGFVLDPTFTNDEGRYNLWRGFGVPKVPGDWSLIRKHIEDVLADGNKDHADYIIRWIAWKLQNPAGIPRVALLFRGDEGIGKGFLCNGLVTMFGSHGLRVHSMMQVAGRFNAHMRHLCILFADEATVVDEEQEGALKGIITEPTLPIEGKGKDIIHADNHLAVVMASNKQWMVPAGIGARRFAVFNVSSKFKGNADYFSRLFAHAGNGGWAAMLHDLLAMKLGKWHPEAHRPDTAALIEQQIQSLKGLERIVADCLLTGEIPCGELRGEHIFIPTTVFSKFIGERTRNAEPSANEVQHLLGRVLGFEKDDKARPRGWVLPPLAEARAAWDRARFIVTWPEVDGWSMGIDDYRHGGEVSDAF